jgi:hypothetical protein
LPGDAQEKNWVAKQTLFLHDSFSARRLNFVPLASKLIAHQLFHSSLMAQCTVLASDLAAFHDSLKLEMQWKHRSARND